MSFLEAESLTKHYGKHEVVRGISLSMKQGEVVGLLGPNGAGKTTTFYMLIGIVKPTSGLVRYDGTDVTDWPLHERARVGLSYLPQESSIFRKLTVRQNLELILEHTGLPINVQRKRADMLLEEFRITRIADSMAMHLSGGERRRLEIARALIRKPRFILLDEPFAGIDPLAVDDIQSIIRGLSNRGIGVLISDHNVRETLNICDRAYLVYEGQIILNGTPSQIVNDPKARRVYLGEGFCL
ncbi:LPS export ABC transporter ATP-binding protein [Desulfovibrio psychrotolerans]|uniref:Lipopolysaccharide export system ATP-binding protein LptB n=1 Tax=Desulfovibrio psychrotolerans TaxID=415242 RepID=A0A7J0BP21_9BACT|nr:LPS export ABC transporter ATP-binding protein [Desulfovibrio psychrotolerans]GFM35443.1 ABC transporter ATP-binding protein [Desulfovibrio psychrotolerans]